MLLTWQERQRNECNGSFELQALVLQVCIAEELMDDALSTELN
jgi:hypothetical protein